MIALLLGLGGKLLARPALLAGVVGLSIFGIREWQHHREANDFRAEISRQQGLFDAEHIRRLDTLTALQGSQQTVLTLQADITKQNAAIASLQTQMRAKELEAGLAATRAFTKGQAAAEALRQPTSTVKPGNEAMNVWLAERFK